MTISFSDWLSESAEHFRNSDRSVLSRIARPLYYVYVGAFLTATRWRQYGTNVFDREWDTLIVLDACRVDALREVADEYDFIDQVDSITSVGSTSFEWLNHTFSEAHLEEVRETAYVTGNGYTERVFDDDGHTGHASIPFGPENYNVVDESDFGYLEELWRMDFEESSEWMIGDGDETRVHPRYTTDRAIQDIRDSESDGSVETPFFG